MEFVVGAQFDQRVSQREAEHRQLAYKAACEGIVLLENNGCLPLPLGNIALYGSGAIATIKGGTGSGEVNERYSVNILDGLNNAGFTVTSLAWLADYEDALKKSLSDYEAHCQELARQEKNILKIMDVTNYPYIFPIGRPITESDIAESKTDTAIYVIARQAGECGDKRLDNGDYNLMPEEIAHLRTLSATYKNTIFVINSGSSMDISAIDDLHLSAVVFFCQQGEEGGNALADILCGKVTPSGKLTDTWAKRYEDIPFGSEYSYLNGNTDKEYYHEGIYVGYRYTDTFGITPRYHFGFGLSYTTFEITPKYITAEGENICATVLVKNTGKSAGKEVVQAYVSCPAGALDKEYQRLVAFAKTPLLEPGMTAEMTLFFSINDCASYDEARAAYVLEPGSYIVRIGNASNCTVPAAALLLDTEVITTKLKNVCAKKETFEELKAAHRENEMPDIPCIHLVPEKIAVKAVEYHAPKSIDDPEVKAVMDRLSTDEMIRVCVGSGLLGMFNASKIATLGAVGRTTDTLYKKGLVNVNLTDGPAGVRILKRSSVKKGRVRMIDYMIGFMKYLPKWIKWYIMANPKKDKIYYQYATAFPVGTSLAQTWNVDLCYQAGRAISVEMDEFNATYWLAPAMNIHRNPLCGRNFEYYSEDPVLTGKIAAAVVRGVQSISGNYAVPKHFAANNQEENRNKVDSILSERALREIYLRGFEICVKDAAPKAFMTSYNKINGIYTANSYELLTDVLRCEWGFDGIVMTDWYSTNQGLAGNPEAITAGNDMIMPGGGSYEKELKNAIKTNKLAPAALKLSCARIVKQILHSNVARKYSPHDFK